MPQQGEKKLCQKIIPFEDIVEIICVQCGHREAEFTYFTKEIFKTFGERLHC
jgi:hypothetical protein